MLVLTNFYPIFARLIKFLLKNQSLLIKKQQSYKPDYQVINKSRQD